MGKQVLNDGEFFTKNKVPSSVKEAFKTADKYFPTPIQQLQYYDKYARFNYDLGRRETWPETVGRAVNYLKKLSDNRLEQKEYDRIQEFILTMRSSPSLRLLAMAGPAAERNSTSIYNCSYLPIDSIDSFTEVLIVAMAGTGVGYSVEHQYVNKLPIVKTYLSEQIIPTHLIEDSTMGWANAFRKGLESWFNGLDVKFDYSQIRPAGAPLKIKGGRASGPKPLEDLMKFTRKIILGAQNRQLVSLEVHDVCCKIGEAIVSGGVRRTALISLFDIDDKEMRDCKNGDLTGLEHRFMSNNSSVWIKNPTQKQILDQMYEMINNQKGEPGIFSRYNANRLKPAYRKEAEFGCNPCAEINLRPYEFCNLSIAIARENDTEESLKEKVEVASIIGTLQSLALNFEGLRDIWKQNCMEERLLGVDISGWRDCKLLDQNNPDLANVLQRLQDHAVAVNEKFARILGINKSASVTCVKPAGNSGILFNCSSGLHTRWAPYYIRNMRIQTQSPLRRVLLDAGVPMDPENGQKAETANTWVVHIPMKSPEGSLTRADVSALDQCEYWLLAKKFWTSHNPSVTITYDTETEVVDLIKWISKHKEFIGGLSFLPSSDIHYSQMPNEEITKDEYEQKIKNFPFLDFSKLWLYEHEDTTSASSELACVSGSCSLEDYQALQTAKELQII